ncbi:ribosomal maturation YjgA family protein [Flavobacterium pallidum]|uniref:DUF2809 domain-containing protein n=1 Tax=Flavobacterium pallidum TaxID=2172098 RepID=A0A2S1SH25_9FLAO|nr:DUF2809 domain-containing protein [Flavobacterium pallidum]AWI25716.1 DUF2809 domain-containing protein [Flavobacterium pallidum]
MALRFHFRYFCSFLLLFATECLIAMYVHDQFVRPYVGDMLVVVLIYCFVKTFLKMESRKVALGVLLFSYLIEFAQHLHLVALLGLKDSRMANLILGNSFEWIDMIAYTVGIAVVLIVDKKYKSGVKEKLR